MNHIDLFSGIGGFALAAQQVWEDYETVAFCDNDRFCQRVLRKRFPGVPIYGDIRELTKERFIADTYSNGLQEPRGEQQASGNRQLPEINLLTGGFPCQPFSQAGKRKGTDDNRYLWPEMLRVISDFKPTWVIAENVRGILTIKGGMVFEQVCTDLETSGYEVQAFIIPAVSVNAPHRRDRVWFVANRNYTGERTSTGDIDEDRKKIGKEWRQPQLESGRQVSDAPNSVCERGRGRSEQGQRLSGQQNRNGSDQRGSWDQNWLEVATRFCGVDDGLPVSMDGFELSKSRNRVERLKSLGNSIVPQVAMEIMKAIKFSKGV